MSDYVDYIQKLVSSIAQKLADASKLNGLYESLIGSANKAIADGVNRLSRIALSYPYEHRLCRRLIPVSQG